MAALALSSWWVPPSIASAPPQSPGTPPDPAERVRHLYETERREDALEAARAWLEGSPGASAPRAWIGRIQLALGEVDAAIEALEEAVEIEPERSRFHLWLGQAYLEKVDRVSIFRKLWVAGRGRSSLERAVAIDPEDVEARTWLTNYYWSAPGIAGGDDDEALRQVEEIRSRDPAQAHRLMATFHWGEDDHGAAIGEYRALLALTPDDGQAWFDLGRLLQEIGDFEASVRALEHSLELDPDRLAAHYWIGRAGALGGNGLERARQALETWLANAGEEPDATRASARWRLGKIHEHRGDLEAAVEEYERALSLDPERDEIEKALDRARRRLRRREGSFPSAPAGPRRKRSDAPGARVRIESVPGPGGRASGVPREAGVASGKENHVDRAVEVPVRELRHRLVAEGQLEHEEAVGLPAAPAAGEPVAIQRPLRPSDDLVEDDVGEDLGDVPGTEPALLDPTPGHSAEDDPADLDLVPRGVTEAEALLQAPLPAEDGMPRTRPAERRASALTAPPASLHRLDRSAPGTGRVPDPRRSRACVGNRG